jgi:isoquinoline 1-oxidoreductase subunit alpha
MRRVIKTAHQPERCTNGSPELVIVQGNANRMAYTLNVNGQTHTVDVHPDTPLLWAIRDSVGLTGYQIRLRHRAMRGLHRPLGGRVADVVKAAWIAADVPQCGYCQSGQVVSAVALLSEARNPTDKDIDLAMNGNVCRCATYHRIRAAIP